MASKSNLELERICELMPKVELHAHLNGSISDAIIQDLLLQGSTGSRSPALPQKDVDVEPLSKKPKTMTETGTGVKLNNIRTLEDCWIIFAKIHEVIRTPRLLFLATVAVIKDFSNDNVVYLELRTTPKQVHSIPSKKVYIETVIRAIEYARTELQLPITVKLLLSLDRKNSARHHLENICLAKWYSIKNPKVLGGIDLSGYPKLGDIKKILFSLNFAKKLGLRISIHLPEVKNLEDSKALLTFPADRYAHGLYLHPKTGGNDDLWNLLKERDVCMETCISSNVITGLTPSVEGHYVQYLIQEKLPFCICTDDSGVFGVTLSDEYKKLLQTVPSITLKDLKELSFKTSSCIFGDEEEIKKIQKLMESFWENK